jgi:predicted acylesterase/phospholipase RssA
MSKVYRTAVVATGGGLRGICIETGLLLALAEREEFVIQKYYGTSAGAVTSAFAASNRLQELYEVLLNSKTSDLMDKQLGGWLRLVLNKAPYSLRPIQNLLEK